MKIFGKNFHFWPSRPSWPSDNGLSLPEQIKAREEKHKLSMEWCNLHRDENKKLLAEVDFLKLQMSDLESRMRDSTNQAIDTQLKAIKALKQVTSIANIEKDLRRLVIMVAYRKANFEVEIKKLENKLEEFWVDNKVSVDELNSSYRK